MSVDLRIRDFIDNDLKVFSNLDNVRSIPSLIDGFKDSQRKALYGMIKKGSAETKVSQLASYIAMETHYDHGEVSMAETVVKMAQNFTGSNNVNLFEPIGQFGSILSSEASAVRYIYTKPSKFLRQYFNKDDDNLLEYREEEGHKLEPINYLPIVPMWLVNGVSGIGTGHASTILSRDPRKVADLVSKLIKGVAVQDKTIAAAMTPYFEGWKGKIEKREALDDTKWDMYGTLEKINTTTLRVTELPVSYDLDKFKSILIALMEDGKVKDFENAKSTENGFVFDITVPREIARKEMSELITLFKLKVGVGENVTLWDENGKLRRYASAYEALLAFIAFRVSKYLPRKRMLLAQWTNDIELMRAKASFIDAWNNRLDKPHKMKKDVLVKELLTFGIKEEYLDKLLAMQISSLTLERAIELSESIQALAKKYIELSEKSPEQLYLEDLAEI
jgi:DNA topoisomerase-2